MTERRAKKETPSTGRPPGYLRALLSVVEPSAETARSERSFDIVASSDTVDRYGRIIVQDWDLEAFIENPVVGWNHFDDFAEPDAQFPIGLASNVRVEDGELRATITFAEASVNPLAERVYQLFKAKILRAFSVGWDSKDIRVELHEGVDVLVCSQNSLIEISACAIGANPDALTERARLVASLRARAQLSSPEVSSMAAFLTLIAMSLGMAADSSEEKIVSRAKEMSAERASLLEATGETDVGKARGMIVGLKASAAESEKTLALLEAKGRETEVARLIETEGKKKRLEPAEIAGFLKACGAKEVPDPADPKKTILAGADPVMFASCLAAVRSRSASAKIEEPTTESDDSVTAATASLSARERRMATANGWKPEEYAAHKAKFLAKRRAGETRDDEDDDHEEARA